MGRIDFYLKAIDVDAISKSFEPIKARTERSMWSTELGLSIRIAI
jgi:hypothetical protein